MLLWLVLPLARANIPQFVWQCFDSCPTANNGLCEEAASQNSMAAHCPCGSDCYDCGPSLCASCGEDLTCTGGGGFVWCCDDETTVACDDYDFDRGVGLCEATPTEGGATSHASTKTLRPIAVVAIALLVVVVLATYHAYAYKARKSRHSHLYHMRVPQAPAVPIAMISHAVVPVVAATDQDNRHTDDARRHDSDDDDAASLVRAVAVQVDEAIGIEMTVFARVDRIAAV